MAVVRIDSSRGDEVIDALCDAFRDYAVMRFVLKDAGDEYESRLRQLVGYFTWSRLTRRWPVLAVESGGQLVAAANINPPEPMAAPPELRAIHVEMCRQIGPAAVARFDAFAEACDSLEPRAPHFYLGMLGVRQANQGQGHARLLLDDLHAMSAAHPSSTGVVLTTEVERNLPLYRHFGYRVLGDVRVDELQTWTLFRPDRP